VNTTTDQPVRPGKQKDPSYILRGSCPFNFLKYLPELACESGLSSRCDDGHGQRSDSHVGHCRYWFWRKVGLRVGLSRFRDWKRDDRRGCRGTGQIRIVGIAANQRNQPLGFICRFLGVLGKGDLRTLGEDRPSKDEARRPTSDESESFSAPPFSWSDISRHFLSSSRSHLSASRPFLRATSFSLILV